MRNESVVKEERERPDTEWNWGHDTEEAREGNLEQMVNQLQVREGLFEPLEKSWTIAALEALCILAGNTSWLLILQTQIVDVWNGKIRLLCLPLWQPNAELFQKEIPSAVECPRKVGWIGKWKALGATDSAQLCKQIDCYK